MKWIIGESLKCHRPSAAFGEGFRSKERRLPGEMADCQERGGELRMGHLQMKGMVSWPRWDCLCVPMCALPWAGALLYHGTMTQAQCWASPSCLVPQRQLEPPTAEPAPPLQGRSCTQLCPWRGQKGRRRKRQKEEKGSQRSSLPLYL